LSEGISFAAPQVRDVFVGCHSKVWQALSRRSVVAARSPQAIGHRELANFAFAPRDRVWILSYSRVEAENVALLELLRHSGVHETVYVSSSSTIASTLTACYEYPRVKARAELDALTLPNAKVLTIGLMYDDTAQLPAGTNVATSYDELAAFVASPAWPEDGARRKHLFRIVRRPFSNAAEQWAYLGYGRLMQWAGARPCLLRPLDVLLRALGARWYGYVYLSNRLWISTIS
jgi:hypothetical protein